MNKFVCVLKSGGDYYPKQVAALKRQVDKYIPSVDEFICYTDIDFTLEGVTCKPLVGRLPGKWSMQEVFREKGKVMATGLDLILYKNLDWLYELADQMDKNTFYGMNSFRNPKKWGNNPMLWRGDWSKLFYKFQNHPYKVQLKLEQEWTHRKLIQLNADVRRLDDKGLKIYSYKHHIKGNEELPEDMDMMVFHGNPRPWAVENEQLRLMYNG